MAGNNRKHKMWKCSINMGFPENFCSRANFIPCLGSRCLSFKISVPPLDPGSFRTEFTEKIDFFIPYFENC